MLPAGRAGIGQDIPGCPGTTWTWDSVLAAGRAGIGQDIPGCPETSWTWDTGTLCFLPAEQG